MSIALGPNSCVSKSENVNLPMVFPCNIDCESAWIISEADDDRLTLEAIQAIMNGSGNIVLRDSPCLG
jgi:hypothetical protein